MIAKIGLVASTVGFAIFGMVAQVVDPITTGQQIGQMTTAGVLGVVAVASVIGLVMQYKDQRKDREATNAKMFEIIEKNTEAHQESVTKSTAVTGILVEVKDELIRMQGKK